MTLLLTKPNDNYGAATKYLHVSNKCQKISNNLLADRNNIFLNKTFSDREEREIHHKENHEDFTEAIKYGI